MYEQGFIPRNRMFELERAVAFLSGQRSEDLANIGRARSQISETRLKILQSKELYRKDVETHLAEVQREVADQRERYIAVRDDLERVVVRSPSTGVVVDMSVYTVGGVITAGQQIMDVVPADQPLQVEVRIPTQLIDNVHPGLDADIHFPALDQFEVPRIPGRLVYVSADRLTEPRNEESYFLGRIEVKPESMGLLGKHQLQTGMPANVVIITGERSFLSYVVRPILARLQFAFTER
jgi:protease secretion system membrane fusion protein